MAGVDLLGPRAVRPNAVRPHATSVRRPLCVVSLVEKHHNGRHSTLDNPPEILYHPCQRDVISSEAVYEPQVCHRHAR